VEKINCAPGTAAVPLTTMGAPYTIERSQLPAILAGWHDGRFWVKVPPLANHESSASLMHHVRMEIEAMAPTLKGAVDPLIMVDLADCRHMDSTFAGSLICLNTEATDAGSRLCVVEAGGQPLELLRQFGLDQVFEVIPAGSSPRGLLAPQESVLQALERGSRGDPVHVLEAHEALSQTGTDNEAAFRSVVELMKEELRQDPKVPALAAEAAETAIRAAFSSGESILSASEGALYEIFPNGVRHFRKALKPRVAVQKGARISIP